MSTAAKKKTTTVANLHKGRVVMGQDAQTADFDDGTKFYGLTRVSLRCLDPCQVHKRHRAHEKMIDACLRL